MKSSKFIRIFSAVRTPHVYLLQKKGSDLVVQYIGAIDNNYQDASKVNTPYLANALDALIAGNEFEYFTYQKRFTYL